MQDGTVTVRHRDTMQQERVKATDLSRYVQDALAAARN
jgi:glycyl-tRNA synthetase (class II)